MAFNYGLNLEAGSLRFNIDIATGSTTNKLQLYSDASNVDLIREYLPTNKEYKVLCFIYSEDGKILEQFSHTHSSTGTCGDLWTFSKLTTGNTYTMQLRFVSSEDDTITFLSDVKDFVYDATQAFKVTYTVTEV